MLLLHHHHTTPWSRNQHPIAAVRDLGRPFAPWRILRRWSTCCEEVARSARLRPVVASGSGGEADTIAERRAHHGRTASQQQQLIPACGLSTVPSERVADLCSVSAAFRSPVAHTPVMLAPGRLAAPQGHRQVHEGCSHHTAIYVPVDCRITRTITLVRDQNCGVAGRDHWVLGIPEG